MPGDSPCLSVRLDLRVPSQLAVQCLVTICMKLQYVRRDCVCAVQAPRRTPGELADSYLGMLYPTEDYKVYGYYTNTRIKLILVVDEPIAKDDEMRLVCFLGSTIHIVHKSRI